MSCTCPGTATADFPLQRPPPHAGLLQCSAHPYGHIKRKRGENMFRSKITAVGCAAAASLRLALAAAPVASASTSQDVNGRYTAQEIHDFLGEFYGEHGPSTFARQHWVSDVLQEKIDQS